MKINFKATKVFQDTYNAINAVNPDGSRKYSLIVQEGGSRSSKTWSDFQCLFNILMSRPYTSITVLRDTAVDCKDIVESDWINWLSDPNNRASEFERGDLTGQEMASLVAKEEFTKFFNRNKTKSIWTAKHNNSSIRFTGLDDVDKVMGMTQDICWINEPYKFSHEVFKQLAQRTSMFILCDWNPKQSHWIEEEKKKDTSITLKSSFRDNPFIKPQTKQQLLSYQTVKFSDVVKKKLINEQDAKVYDFESNDLNFTEKQIKELKRCIYNESHGGDDYMWQVFGEGEKAEKPNKIFTGWNEITFADFENIEKPDWYGVDWGKVDPFGIVRAKYTDGRLYVHELNYSSENDIISSFTDEQRFNINKEYEEGVVVWLFNKLGIDKNRPIICDTNRPDKVRAIYNLGYEYADTADKGQGSIIEGIDILSKLEVYYTRESRNIKNEFENYSFKKDRYGATTEEPEDDNNHLMDCIRYVVLRLKKLGIIKKI